VRVGRITDGARMGNRDKSEALAGAGAHWTGNGREARDAGGAVRNTTATRFQPLSISKACVRRQGR
jgi:hypothetical protein